MPFFVFLLADGSPIFRIEFLTLAPMPLNRPKGYAGRTPDRTGVPMPQ